MPLSWLFGRKGQNASSQVQIRDKALQFFKRPLLCFDIWPMFTALLDRAFGIPLSLRAIGWDEDTGGLCFSPPTVHIFRRLPS
jgi:hypothetical protein